jgi:hypothetical protein
MAFPKDEKGAASASACGSFFLLCEWGGHIGEHIFDENAVACGWIVDRDMVRRSLE